MKNMLCSIFKITFGVHEANRFITSNINYVNCAHVEQACQPIINYSLATKIQGLDCLGIQK